MRICNFVLAGLLAVSLAGCGPIAVKADPDAFSVENEMPALRAGQNLAIANAYTSETKKSVALNSSLVPDWEVDMQQLTDTAVAILERHAAKSGFSVSKNADKKITLYVREITANNLPIPFNPRWTVSVVMDARLSNGTTITVAGDENTPAHFGKGQDRAIAGAILHAIENLLKDTRFVTYVNG